MHTNSQSMSSVLGFRPSSLFFLMKRNVWSGSAFLELFPFAIPFSSGEILREPSVISNKYAKKTLIGSKWNKFDFKRFFVIFIIDIHDLLSSDEYACLFMHEESNVGWIFDIAEYLQRFSQLTDIFILQSPMTKMSFCNKNPVRNVTSVFKVVLEIAGNYVPIPSTNRSTDFSRSCCPFLLSIANSMNSSSSFNARRLIFVGSQVRGSRKNVHDLVILTAYRVATHSLRSSDLDHRYPEGKPR